MAIARAELPGVGQLLFEVGPEVIADKLAVMYRAGDCFDFYADPSGIAQQTLKLTYQRTVKLFSQGLIKPSNPSPAGTETVGQKKLREVAFGIASLLGAAERLPDQTERTNFDYSLFSRWLGGMDPYYLNLMHKTDDPETFAAARIGELVATTMYLLERGPDEIQIGTDRTISAHSERPTTDILAARLARLGHVFNIHGALVSNGVLIREGGL